MTSATFTPLPVYDVVVKQAERSGRVGVREFGAVIRAGVRDVHLAEHLAQHLGEIVVVVDVRQEFLVGRVVVVPVDVLQVREDELLLELPPAVVEDVAPSRAV